ncbi:uncharacterized protein LOC120421607 isoform X2 [Culex pipiens pallens]|uniref:uncharacterized protein LOC120421607 isoform X2 n=1 Tax=Culex pipiens pallens TaxID=42434 RepID=UPI001953B09C|nr:uncharacterized protein LOC120421607 isoform X2 [Culex pipiens pallens]
MTISSTRRLRKRVPTIAKPPPGFQWTSPGLAQTLTAFGKFKGTALQLCSLEASQIIATIPKTSTFVMRDIESIPKGIGAGPRKPDLDPYITNRRPRRKPPHGFHILLQIKTKSEFLRLLLHITDESCTHFDINTPFPGRKHLEPITL